MASSNPIEKYKGQYRVRCEIDEETNDYPRELKKDSKGRYKPIGEYVHNDIYIECRYGKVYWVGRSTYEVWVKGIVKFNNLLKKFKKDIISIVEGEGEGSFVFPESIIHEVISSMGGGYITKVNDSPFKSGNLEYSDYKIPPKDKEQLKAIAESKSWDMSTYGRLYNSFVEEVLYPKDKDFSSSFRSDCRKQKLKTLEYIHKNGYWDSFIEYAKSYK